MCSLWIVYRCGVLDRCPNSFIPVVYAPIFLRKELCVDSKHTLEVPGLSMHLIPHRSCLFFLYDHDQDVARKRMLKDALTAEISTKSKARRRRENKQNVRAVLYLSPLPSPTPMHPHTYRRV